MQSDKLMVSADQRATVLYVSTCMHPRNGHAHLLLVWLLATPGTQISPRALAIGTVRYGLGGAYIVVGPIIRKNYTVLHLALRLAVSTNKLCDNSLLNHSYTSLADIQCADNENLAWIAGRM